MESSHVLVMSSMRAHVAWTMGPHQMAMPRSYWWWHHGYHGIAILLVVAWALLSHATAPLQVACVVWVVSTQLLVLRHTTCRHRAWDVPAVVCIGVVPYVAMLTAGGGCSR